MTRIWAAILAWSVSGCLYADTRGGAQFTPPAGWAKDTSQSFTSFLKASENTFCQISVYDDQPAGATLDDSFRSEWGGVFTRTFAPSPAPPWTRSVSPAGHPYASGEAEVADLRRNRFYARLSVFQLGIRVQSVVWIATHKAALDRCAPEWESFLASLRFPSAPSPRDAVAPPPPAASPAAATVPQIAPAAGRFGNIRYTTPPGWTVASKPNQTTLTPVRLQGEESLIIVLLPPRPAGPLDREFASTWNEIAAGFGAQSMRNVSGQTYDLDPTRQIQPGVDCLTGNGGIMLNSLVYTVRPYLFRVGGQIERFFAMARDFQAGLVTTNAFSNPRFEPDLARFLVNLRFTDSNESARPAASPRGRGIVGVWGGIGMSAGSLKPQTTVFLSDGSAYFGPSFPLRGLHEIEPAVERELTPRYWGSWRMSGSDGVLQMPYGPVPLRMEGESLVLTTSNTEHRYIRLPILSAEMLTGAWCLVPGPGCLALSAEGGFRDEGALRVLEHATYPYPGSLPRGEGSYHLVDHTLIFKYDSGPEFRLAVPGQLDDKPTVRPNRIWLGFHFDELQRR